MVLLKEVMNSDGPVIFERRTLDKANLVVLTKNGKHVYVAERSIRSRKC